MKRKSMCESPLSRTKIDAIWMHAAGQLGFVVSRTEAAYATSDGKGGIAIGVPATLDHDDSVAQLVFHELCHALVQGESALAQVDWGLDNTSDEHVDREYAALRIQAHLAQAHGLRWQMAPTTQWRPYYEALSVDAIAGDDNAARIASEVLLTPMHERWGAVLASALAATAAVLDADQDAFAQGASL